MMRHHKFSAVKALVLLGLGLWTIRCGSAGKSSQISMSVVPGQPNVITADFQYNSTTTISAPWFPFQVSVHNGSDETVTIIALQLHVIGTRADGTSVTKDITVSPTMYNFTATCSGGTTQEVDFSDFGEIAANTTSQLTLTPRNITSLCGTAISGPLLTPLLYAGGNPSKTSDHVLNYSYTVQLTPAGWFGTHNAPDQRFDKVLVFGTY